MIDDIAYFGVSVWSERSARGDPSQDSEIAAFCLRGMDLLWRREVGSMIAEAKCCWHLAFDSSCVVAVVQTPLLPLIRLLMCEQSHCPLPPSIAFCIWTV